MAAAFINRIAPVVPRHDIHQPFIIYVEELLRDDPRRSVLFRRMAARSGIAHRYSCLSADNLLGNAVGDGFYIGGFPDTATRMRKFEELAPPLAAEAVEKLLAPEERRGITHLLVTCCTGFSAPGIDLEIVDRCGLPSSVERTMIGFMGCYAAVNALKLARHLVRSEPQSRVLVLNLELCTLHLKETDDMEQLLSFLLFADGCAASLVTAEPTGIALDGFHAVLVPETRDLITWHIRDFGFDMVLSGRVPAAIGAALSSTAAEILQGPPEAVDFWAVHPGGRTVLDAVEHAFALPPSALNPSRRVLSTYGNMSSATIMFVLDAVLRARGRGRRGCAMAFGPGLIAETMRFRLGDAA